MGKWRILIVCAVLAVAAGYFWYQHESRHNAVSQYSWAVQRLEAAKTPLDHSLAKRDADIAIEKAADFVSAEEFDELLILESAAENASGMPADDFKLYMSCSDRVSDIGRGRNSDAHSCTPLNDRMHNRMAAK